MEPCDVVQLNQLAYRYAAAVDGCDEAAFLKVFTPDARLRSFHPGASEPFTDLKGPTQLALVPIMMREMFSVTAHMMTNPLVDLQGDRATGTVLCTARHLSKDPDDTTALSVIIRYIDRYERRDGEWRISDREIRFLWSQRNEVIDSGLG